ncbi:hypothetical protein D3C77_361120 [compost metagenome]
MIRCRWLLLEYVEGRAGHDALIDRIHQCQLIDYAAASAVDNAHAFLHHLKLRTGNHMLRLRRQRCVDRHEVGVAYNFVDGGKLHAQLLGALLRHERIIAEDVHAERFGAFGNFAADAAHAEYAQLLVAQLNAEEFAVPSSLNRLGVSLRNMAGKSHHHCKSVLACRNRVAVRSVDNDDTAFSCRIQVDVIDADACAADHFQIGSGFHDFLGDFRLAANEQSVIAGNDLDKLILRKSRLFLYYNVACVHQLLNSQVADRI